MAPVQVRNLTFGAKKEQIDRDTERLDREIKIHDNEKLSPRLKISDSFVYRAIGNGDQSTNKALDTIGVKSMDELVNQVVPSDILLNKNQAFKHNGKEL
jgi:hypothetical protein